MKKLFPITIFLFIIARLAIAQNNKDILFEQIGVVKSRHAKEISSSKISIGAEMMDRDFTIYKNWREYLGPLGVKKARIQSGWAKCEKEKGIYNWAWLDEIIPDMVYQGVEPWVNLSYGNSIYSGGGGTTIFSKALPSTPEAMQAWINYVVQIVSRYMNYVDEWEIWNEPNYEIDFCEYADFFINTAEAIKSIQPDAKILALGLGSKVDYEFADKVLSVIFERGKIELIDEVTHHRHQAIPEFVDTENKLAQVIGKYSKKIVVRQGEAGCPSTEMGDYFAMKDNNWTELQQAKTVLRRLMVDLGRGKETSVFTIIDALYIGKNGEKVWNTKGLLKSNDNLKVEYQKPAFTAVQNVTSIFDNSLRPLSHFAYETDEDKNLYCFAHENIHSKRQLVVLWKGNNIATHSETTKNSKITIYGGNFENPVWVDLRTGQVKNIQESAWTKKGNKYEFNSIPIYDSPILIADKSLVQIKE